MASSGSNNTSRNRPRNTLSRSNSFLGTIKNLVTAPLTWFTATDGSDTEEAKGKRRRLSQSDTNDDLCHEEGSKNKKLRVSSPDRRVDSGYLDPPDVMLRPSGVHLSPQSHSFDPTGTFRPSSSVFTPFDAVQRQPPYRHSVSPFASIPEVRPLSMTRTMSLDPPHQYGHSRNSSMALLTRDTSMDALSLRNSMSVIRDVSMPPARSSFYMRTSLTPKPAGSSLALSQRSHESSDPPPVTSLSTNPIFVRAPDTYQRSMSAQPTITLGSYVESQRRTQSPVRQHSSILFAQPGTPSNVSHGNRPVNVAEKALHELDVYKTPLLPTRLKNVSSIPDIFKPKKPHHLIPMHDKDGKSRLGIPEKKKSKKAQVNSTKPYAGEGGMKKLLARRKMEEKEKEKAAEVESHGEAKSTKRHVNDTSKDVSVHKESKYLTYVEPPSENKNGGRSQSSLRVGRTKASRSHFSRPGRPVNRFSARYVDEEGDDQMQGDSEKSRDQVMLEEAAKNVPVFEIKPGFTFTKEAHIQRDISEAKEPPITSLPFSLSRPITPAGASAPSEPKPAQPFDSRESELSKVTVDSSSSTFGSTVIVPSAPTIALIPPAPNASVTQPAAPIKEAKVTEPAANFSAKSSTSEPSISPPSFNLPASGPMKDADKPAEGSSKPSKQPDEPVLPAPLPFSLFSTEKKSPMIGQQDHPVASLQMLGASNISRDAPVSGGTTPSVPLFGSSTEHQPAQIVDSTSSSLFGGPVKLSNPSISSFVAPSRPAEPAPTITPVFTFGQPKVEAPKEAEAATKSTSDASALGAIPPSTTTVGEPAPVTPVPPKLAPGFTSLPPITTSSITQQASGTTSTSTLFSFGQPPTGAVDKNKTPFSFGSAPSTPPAATDKKLVFAFGPSTTASAPAVSFGAPTGSSTGTDVSNKPFSFGIAGAAAVQPVTPPKNDDQDLHMDESPIREMHSNGNNKEPRTSLFSFGSASSTPFGGTSQTGSAPFSFAPSTTTNSFPPKVDTSVAQSTPMTFNGFGQTQPASTGFGFGAKVEPPKAATPTPFSFQATTGPSFTFTPPTTTNNPFTLANSQSGSAPSSPSTFNQPSSAFTFTPPVTNPTAPFTFGSQPSSPASAGGTNLAPPPAGTFTFGSGQTTQPSSPFGASAPAPPPGGALFTIGAAPPSTPHPGRQVKRLPLRRGGKR